MRQLVVVKEKEVKIIREISEEEFKVIQEQINILNLFSKDFNRLTIVINSLKEYDDCIDRYINKRIPNFEFSDDIIKLVLVYVSTFRTFLDQWETYIKRKYGKKSDEIDKFKEATRLEYDEFFSYRFIYELRNYTLHCDMPISQISGRIDEEGKYSVNVFIYRDKLLQTYEWPSKVGIEEMPEEFEIYDHLKQSLECLSRIHQTALNLGDKRKVFEAALAILKIGSDNNESSRLGIIDSLSNNEKELSMKLMPIPLEFSIELIKLLIKSN